ncbi:hypothetical protein QBC42DRAFT_20948 [Cladorrhinum samala]|uniref:Uncharacterized protein n=1 Tax=Cladorrhinum samala TaxID=585594 RepID=A0AAV9HD84_9PEZI|nr:hypothetical protein QBC42DRAFT_20948 [Cladorrhinum samala]
MKKAREAWNKPQPLVHFSRRATAHLISISRFSLALSPSPHVPLSVIPLLGVFFQLLSCLDPYAVSHLALCLLAVSKCIYGWIRTWNCGGRKRAKRLGRWGVDAYPIPIMSLSFSLLCTPGRFT